MEPAGGKVLEGSNGDPVEAGKLRDNAGWDLIQAGKLVSIVGNIGLSYPLGLGTIAI